ncbi:hypothetical protein TSUD_120070 [Trifolium subterraneum]|uniref:Pentacotripeptide-repeat region of PRORP domain-containing protein n=1 Tax=Trifolium subterraneum TaxID=3900 RepID=A0A1B5Z7C0_TRISU|nr:hypothetical protein TSUD_120070 [Trifolium subterraneum]
MPPPQTPNKFYFFYGHRKPSQNRPTVRGGLFSNRQTLTPFKPKPTKQTNPFQIQNWDPHFFSQPNASPPSPSPEATFSASLRLSPIARFIIDAFRKNGYKWGPPVVTELNKLRRVTPNLVAEVLKVQTNPTLAFKFFHWVEKQKGYHHNFASFNAFAYCLNRANHFRAADQLPELMDSQGKPPSEKQFEILIRMHCDAGRGLRVYYVYDKMRNKFGVKPRVFLYNRIMDALVKTGHLDLALSVYSDFKEDGLVEESVTFMVLIKGLCKAGKIDEMLEVLGRMREKLCKPDVFAYTELVRIMVGEGNLDGCLRVWEEMKRDRVEPDVMAYGTIIGGLAKVGRVLEGYELFKEMKGKGHLIDRVIYGSLIESFVVGNKMGLAFDLLKDLVSSGYRADLGIYNNLIEGLCNLNKVEKAYKLFQVTIQEGLEPDFLSGSDLKPDSSTFNIAILCLVDRGEIKEACECHNKIIEMSCIPSIAAYCCLAKGLCEIGEIDEAMMLVRDCLGNVTNGPMEFKYCLTVIHICKSNDAEKVIDVLNEMMQQGCPLGSVVCSAIISGMCKYGTIEEARKVFSNLREHKLLTESDTIVYDEFLIDHMKKKTADLVISGLKFFGLESKLKSKGCKLLPD